MSSGSRLESSSPTHQKLLSNIIHQAYPNRKLISTRKLSVSAGVYLTYETLLDDGTTIIIHWRDEPPSNLENEVAWAHHAFGSGVYISKWLAAHSKFPAPRPLSPPRNPDIFVAEKILGESISSSYSSLSPSAKANLVRSYADLSVDLFKLVVPQYIGTAAPGEPDSVLTVTPHLGSSNRCRAPKVFISLEDYLDHVFTLKRRASILDTNDDDKFRAQAAISQLISHFKRLSSRLTEPSLRRCVLSQTDLRESDVFTDVEGQITGVLSWQLHSIQPAILAVDYPPWLRYDGVNDPRYSPHKVRLEEPEESARLRRIYEERVQLLDRDYHMALTQGAQLRAAVGWVLDTHDDRGCSRMREWMLSSFGPPVSSPSALDDARCVIA
ncbi:hypothetical protein BJ138DRAFT_1089361 [Hygrophoropsis aurantiaca]|uniref:Uncharacterized protein n=1 Tax=Hygrophoropsis aurantiaca TaxID=72124 RepID=A0ACB8A9V2_9AGAM|nr:hypothetical protein BJ138DRAFT_1089361 [Hygrophoropsis aurantiaca]